MNLRHLTARTAIAGVTTALAAGALVGIAPAANAATVSNTYSCTNPLIGPREAVLTLAGDLPVPQYWAGAAVPAGLLTVQASVDQATQQLLAGSDASSASVDDFKFAFGSTTVAVPLAGAVDATTGAWSGAGSNQAFVTPRPGNTSAVLPAKLTFTVKGTIVGDVALACTLKAGETAQTLASIQLLRQASATTAPKSVKAKQGKSASVKVKAKSTSLNAPVTSGKVVAKEGKKVVGKAKFNKKGVAVVKLSKKLKPGKHKVKFTYAGTPSIKGSTAKTVVKVAKK